MATPNKPEPTIKITMDEDGEFYYAPLNNKRVVVRDVPVWLFEGYRDNKMQGRDIRDTIKSYFENTSDKK